MTSAPAPRDALPRAKRLGVPMDPDLESVLAHWDVDDVFNEDLESLMFEIEPLPASELDCHNPWMVVVAMNGGGSAYGRYVHPNVTRGNVAPWVFWEHEEDHIVALSPDTRTFFSGFLADAEEWSDDAERIARVRRSLAELGLACSPGDAKLNFEEGADWLAPLEAALHPLSYYLELAALDPAVAEQGLLAHASRHQETKARAALENMYTERGWTLPFGGFSF